MTTRTSAATITAASAVVVAAVVLASWPTSATSASLQTRATTGSATAITAGSADLSLGTLSMPATPLWPGATVRGSVTARNTGDVPLDLQVAVARPSGPTAERSSTSQSTRLITGLSTTASPATCSAGTSPSTWTGVLGAPASDSGITLRAGSSTVLCLTLSMPSDTTAAAQGERSDFTLTITGTQD